MPSKIAYLAAKRSLEDRTLDRGVWSQFVAGLENRAEDSLRIVEVGPGVGSMIARLASWESFSVPVSYRAIDLDPACIDAARTQLPAWLIEAGYTIDNRADRIVATSDDGQRFEITLETGDAFLESDEADAVIAAAVLDLVDLEPALSDLRGLLDDDGLLFAPCTFDGATKFAPSHDIDDRIERLYHHHMDEIRDQPGSSTGGRDLLRVAPEAGFDVLAAGGMDWLIRPHDEGYPHDDAIVLEHLLETIGGALEDYPTETLDPADLEGWLDVRHTQLECSELTGVVHHLDVLLETGAR